MARKVRIKAKTILTYIRKKVDGAEWREVGCSTGDTFTLNRNVDNGQTKCKSDWAEDEISDGDWSVQQQGEAIVIDESGTPVPSEASIQLLSQLALTGEIFEVKMAKVDGSYYRGGDAILTAYTETANATGAMTYNATFKGQGEPIMVAPVEP